jgi:hypothetical protein
MSLWASAIASTPEWKNSACLIRRQFKHQRYVPNWNYLFKPTGESRMKGHTLVRRELSPHNRGNACPQILQWIRLEEEKSPHRERKQKKHAAGL